MANHELPIPPAASNDKKAIELVRVWAAQGQQHVSLATGVWDDPAAWGILLVDLARHIARSHEAVSGDEYASILNRIAEGFDAEWNSPTDEPEGEILE